MRRAVALVFVLLAACASPRVAEAPQPAASEPYEASAVRVFGLVLERGVKQGSGVATHMGVLTAWHVVDETTRVLVRTQAGQLYMAQRVERVPDVDVALLIFDPPLPTIPLPVSLGGLDGDHLPAICVAFWGRAANESVPIRAIGRVYPNAEIPGGLGASLGASRWLATDIPLARGMSGGPLIVGGYVVGVASIRVEPGEYTYFAPITLGDLRKVAKR